MDPVTHGIAGALLGKGYFSKRHARVAIFSATLGAVFPDVDIFAEFFSHDPLGIVKYHRAITHSFVGLPFFAALLAWLTRWIASRRGIEAPSWGLLTLIYGVGIASHILLDGMTSFGTRMWYPLSRVRVAWDVLFIIDFTFTTIILVPQVIAWIYSGNDVERARGRAVRMWAVFTLGAVVVWFVARTAGYPFHLWAAGIVSVLMAVLFFAPAARGWGFRVTRTAWCQAGTYAMLAYLFACALMHHTAFLRAKAFADQNHIVIERIGALPIPPSLLDWGDAVRSPEGVYKAQFDLRESEPVEFRFFPDSPPDQFIARAFQLPDVALYWQFARFPSIRSFIENGYHVVELGENRFSDGRQRGPQPFTYRVVFDDAGNVLEEGWLTNGMLQRSMMKMARPAAPAEREKQTP
jgi:membrane-bound metal-dependent hydrolase YbcI (DUF457 family)